MTDDTKPVGDYRVQMYESERGWGSDSWYSYFDEEDQARRFYHENLPPQTASTVPDYYIISRKLEKFDPHNKEWKSLIE